jgi:DNA-binding IclR family transcriptional regulator
MTAPDSASVRRLLDVLAVLSDDAAPADGLLPREVGERLGRDRATVAQTLAALVAEGLVDRDRETERLRPGWGLYLLAGRVVAARLTTVAPRYVARLVEETGESAYALRLHGLDSVTEAEQSGPGSLHVASWLGRPFPVYGSDGGPALLLDATREELEERFGGVAFEPFGPNTPRNAGELYERVERARARGWALLDEEGEPGVASAAAPVRSFGGEIAVALAVAGPRFRVLPRVEAIGRAVAAAAAELSAELGYQARSALRTAADSRAAAETSSSAAASALSAMRTDGAEISIAATIRPAASRTGAAIPTSPGSGSSSRRT